MSRVPFLLCLVLIQGLWFAMATSAQQASVAPAASPAGSPPTASSPPQPAPAQISPLPTASPPSPPSPATQTQPAQPVPQPPPSAAPPPASPVVPAEQVAPVELTGVLGEVVLGPGDARLGHIVDVLADSQGRLRAVVVDVGGFMGVGNRKVAVAWAALHFAPSDKGPVISILIPADRIKSWAEYIPGRPVAILGATGSTP